MLINCVAYQKGEKLKNISIEEISHYLTIPGCFVWVAVQDAKLSELEKMREKFDFHTLAFEDAWHCNQRPKIEEYGDTVFAVMQLTEMNGDHLTIGEIDVFVGMNYVLSVRIRSRAGFLGVRHRFRSSMNRIC